MAPTVRARDAPCATPSRPQKPSPRTPNRDSPGIIITAAHQTPSGKEAPCAALNPPTRCAPSCTTMHPRTSLPSPPGAMPSRAAPGAPSSSAPPARVGMPQVPTHANPRQRALTRKSAKRTHPPKRQSTCPISSRCLRASVPSVLSPAPPAPRKRTQPVQPDATPCNRLQPHATAHAGAKRTHPATPALHYRGPSPLLASIPPPVYGARFSRFLAAVPPRPPA
jgi:hypothetical protein